jgi:hypothetical protein
MDLDPIISPVIDLSNVKSAAGSISSLFGANPSIGVLANAGAIGMMMNGRNQNGGNSDIVTAIGKLRSDIANMPRNSYQINGITYDDGSNIHDALETIIQAARIERRI